jgi:hypothetical protein
VWLNWLNEICQQLKLEIHQTETAETNRTVLSSIKAMWSVLNYFFKETHVTEAAKDELHEVFEKLSKCGVVKQSKNEFTFVDVDDRYVTEGVKVIKKFGFDATPYFVRGLVGADISVMDEEEAKGVAVKDLLRTEVTFTLSGCNIVAPKGEGAVSPFSLG